MPSRILREGILTSDRVDSLTPQAEVFYRRLMSVVDDYGRFDGRPGLIRVNCFPLRVDVVREADISHWIAECVMAGLIALYAVDGKPYLEMQEFRQQVRARSKYPPPIDGQMLCACEADAKQVLSRPPATVHLGGVGDGVGVECEDGVEVSSEPLRDSKPPPDLSGLQIPLNDSSEYDIPEKSLAEWKTAFPAVDVEQELREMRAWALASPTKRKTRRGVSAFIVRWLSKEQDHPSARSEAPPAPEQRSFV